MDPIQPQPKRNYLNYVGMTRLGRANNHYAQDAAKDIPRKPVVTILNHINEFFSNNIIGWFIHDWQVKPPYGYPPIDESSIHNIDAAPVTIAIAADWATDTLQSEFVGQKIDNKNADYTVHLGDTYFSGTEKELEPNFWAGSNGNGLWPRGAKGSFALCGNHEMFSSGTDYRNMIINPARKFGIRTQDTQIFSGQPSPNFCLRTPHWLVLGLDTGYESLRIGRFRLSPDNINLSLPDIVERWLREKVIDTKETRGIIVLTHHEYVSAFHGEKEFSDPARQLQSLLPNSKGILWIWGHEHRFAMYGKNQIDTDHITAYGRCIGNGGMPDEHTHCRFVDDKRAVARNLVLYDKRTADHIKLGDGENAKVREVGFNGYVTLRLEGEQAQINYYAAYKINLQDTGRDQLLITETWQTTNGQINCTNTIDFTFDQDENNRVAYFGDRNPHRIGNTNITP